MEKNRVKLLTIILAISIIALPLVVLADSWKYYTEITIQDTGGSDRAGIPVIIDTVKGQNLIDASYVNSDATDTRVKEGATEIKYCIASDETLLYTQSLAAEQKRDYRLYMGYSPIIDSFAIIVGQDGYITIPDDSSIEFGNQFDLELKGYVDTSESDKNLVYKEDAFRLYISAENKITAAILGAGGVSIDATGVESGVHVVRAKADTVDLKLIIDGNEHSIALSGASVVDNANDWQVMQDNVMPYMEYLKLEV